MAKYLNSKLLYVFFLLLTLTLLNRAFYLQVLFFVLLLFLFILPIKQKVKLFFSAIFILVVAFVFFNSSDMLAGTNLERRIIETLDIINDGVTEETSIPMMQRMYEAQMVSEQFEMHPFRYIFGFGFGATFDMTGSLDSSVINSQLLGADSTHNVHFLHTAILFRHGVIGIVFYGALFFFSLLNIFKVGIYIKKNGFNYFSCLFFISNIYVVSLVVNSSTASSSFFTDPLLPVMLALTCYLRRSM